MEQSDQDTLREAERLMKAHRYGEAITAFEARLAQNSNDLRALLEMGLCHLLNRSEATFVAIHREASQHIHRLGEVPPAIARLWDQYQQLFRKVTATALVVGTVAGISSCSETDDGGNDTLSSHRYSGGVLIDAAQQDDATDASESSDVISSHRYSGGVFVDAAEQDASTDASTSSDVISSHRYSGGVFVDAAEQDTSASDDAAPPHRYSGGMFFAPTKPRD